MASNSYQYTPLDRGSREIRLITILPGDVENELYCECFHTKLEDAPDYECLSYAWGAPDLARTILIDGCTLHITANLEVALRHLRYASDKRVMWIDAICINQEDKPERSQQVGIMGDIYASAQRVVVWIGPEDKTSNRALEFLRVMGKERARELSNTWIGDERQGSSVSAGDEEERDTELQSTETDASNRNDEDEVVVTGDGNGEEFTSGLLDESNVNAADPSSSQSSVKTPPRNGSYTTLKEALRERLISWKWKIRYELREWRRRWDPIMRYKSRLRWRNIEKAYEENRAHSGDHMITGFPVLYDNSYYRFFKDDTYLQDWLAVDALFARPWFYRTWVVQEVWKSANTILQCGNKTLPWKRFEQAMSYSEAWDDMGASIKGTARETEWDSLKRRYSLATHISNKRLLGSHLYSLLWNTWDRESSDPLDKIYAVLGLADENSRGDLQPDYTKSMGVAYREVAQQILLHEKNLDHVLLGGCGPSRQDGLPSWVPDWRHSANQNRPTLFVNRKRLMTMYWTGSMDAVVIYGHGYKAAGETTAVFDFDSPLDTLKVSASVLGTVAEIDLIHPLEASARDILSATASFVKSSKHIWALSRTKYTVEKDFESLLTAGLVDENKDDVLRNVMGHRRFLITNRGDMGIGPAGTVPGDEIFIIAGCNFPMVLRRENDYYVLVGEAYGMYLPCTRMIHARSESRFKKLVTNVADNSTGKDVRGSTATVALFFLEKTDLEGL